MFWMCSRSLRVGRAGCWSESVCRYPCTSMLLPKVGVAPPSRTPTDVLATWSHLRTRRKYLSGLSPAALY